MPRYSTVVEQRFLRELGRRVRSARTARGWSQRKLAVRAGMSPSVVTFVERADSGVDLVRFAYLARALDMSMAELLPGLDLLDMVPPSPGPRTPCPRVLREMERAAADD